jgi:hypothetical protein
MVQLGDVGLGSRQNCFGDHHLCPEVWRSDRQDVLRRVSTHHVALNLLLGADSLDVVTAQTPPESALDQALHQLVHLSPLLVRVLSFRRFGNYLL